MELRQNFHRFFKIVKEVRMTTLAGSLSFFAFLSIFPFLMLTMSIAGLVIREKQALKHLRQILDIFPATLTERLIQVVRGMLENSGLLTLISFVFLVLIAAQIFLQLQNALDQIFSRKRQAGNLKNRLRMLAFFLLFGTLMVMLVLVYGTLAVLASRVTGNIPFLSSTLLIQIASFAVEVLLFSLSYHMLVSAPTSWKSAFLAGFMVTVGWEVLKALFRLYISSMNVYSLLYGSIGSLFLFMLWLYYSILIYLAGAVICRIRND